MNRFGDYALAENCPQPKYTESNYSYNDDRQCYSNKFYSHGNSFSESNILSHNTVRGATPIPSESEVSSPRNWSPIESRPLHKSYNRSSSRTSFNNNIDPAKKPLKKNFSFTESKMRDIEYQNQVLLKKILTTKVSTDLKRSPSTINLRSTQTLMSAAVNNRKKQQREIDFGNDILQRKLRQIANRQTKNVC